jgi:hypothetical protein
MVAKNIFLKRRNNTNATLKFWFFGFPFTRFKLVEKGRHGFLSMFKGKNTWATKSTIQAG